MFLSDEFVNGMMNAMNDGLKLCVLDTSTNNLTCEEPDGSMMQHYLGTTPSGKSMEIKKNAIDELIAQGKRCFDSGKCKEPIQATFYFLESCGLCKSHSLILDNVERDFHDANIPFTLIKKNAREHLDEIKALKCNGPCVTTNRNGKEIKLYEGNKGEVGVISDLLGLPNPLFKKRAK